MIREERGNISQILHDASFETKLKKERIITVLSPDREEEAKIRAFFQKVDFVKVNFKTISAYEDIKCDLVLFNNINPNSQIQNNVLADYNAKAGNRLCFVYYGKFNPTLESFTRTNMANSEFTLYARIMETLKIKEVLKDN